MPCAAEAFHFSGGGGNETVLYIARIGCIKRSISRFFHYGWIFQGTVSQHFHFNDDLIFWMGFDQRG